jgi:serpin B
MTDAFDDVRANFAGMDGIAMLFIKAVLHKAFLEVNEEGTEAAAATAVVMTIKGLPQPHHVFRADHPFLFLIRENSTGSVLFMGRVVDPTASD